MKVKNNRLFLFAALITFALVCLFVGGLSLTPNRTAKALPAAPTVIDYSGMTVKDAILDYNSGMTVTPGSWNTSYVNAINVASVPANNFAVKVKVTADSGFGGYARFFGDYDSAGGWAHIENSPAGTTTKGVIFNFGSTSGGYGVGNIQFCGAPSPTWLSGNTLVADIAGFGSGSVIEFGCYAYDGTYNIAYLKVNNTVIASVCYSGTYSLGSYIGFAGNGSGATTFKSSINLPDAPTTINYSGMTVKDAILDYNGGTAITPTGWSTSYVNAINVASVPTNNFAVRLKVTAGSGFGGYARFFGDYDSAGGWEHIENDPAGTTTKGVIFNFGSTSGGYGVGNIQFCGAPSPTWLSGNTLVADIAGFGGGSVIEFGCYAYDGTYNIAYLKVNDTVIASVAYKGTYSLGSYIGFAGMATGTSYVSSITAPTTIDYSGMTVKDAILDYNDGTAVTPTGSWNTSYVNAINVASVPANNFAVKVKVTADSGFGGYVRFFGDYDSAGGWAHIENSPAGTTTKGVIFNFGSTGGGYGVGNIQFCGAPSSTWLSGSTLVSDIAGFGSGSVIEFGCYAYDDAYNVAYLKVNDTVIASVRYSGTYSLGGYIGFAGNGSGATAFVSTINLPSAPTTIDYTNITVYDVIGDYNSGTAVTPAAWNTTSYHNLVNLGSVPTIDFAYRFQVNNVGGGYVRMLGDSSDGSWVPFENNAEKTAVTKGIIFAFNTSNTVYNIQFAGLSNSYPLSGGATVSADTNGTFYFEFGCYDAGGGVSVAYLKVDNTVIASVAYVAGDYAFGSYIGFAGRDGGTSFEEVFYPPEVDYTKIGTIYDFNDLNNGVMRDAVSTSYSSPYSFSIPSKNNAVKFKFATAGFDGGIQLFATSDTAMWAGAIFLGSNGDFQNNLGGSTVNSYVKGWGILPAVATFETGIYENGDNIVVYVKIGDELRFYYEATGELTHGTYINIYSAGANTISAVEDYTVDYDTVALNNVTGLLGQTELELPASGIYYLGSLNRTNNIAYKFRYYVGDSFDGYNYRQFGFLQDDTDREPIWTGSGFELNFYYNGAGARCGINKGAGGFGAFSYTGFNAGALLVMEFGTYDVDSSNAIFYVKINEQMTFAKSYAKNSVTLGYGLAAQVTNDADSNIRIMDAAKHLVDIVYGSTHSYHVVDTSDNYVLPVRESYFAYDIEGGIATEGLYQAGDTVALTGDVTATAKLLDFALENGGYARLKSDISGLSFKATIGDDYYALYSSGITEMGIIIVPTDYITSSFDLTSFSQYKVALTSDVKHDEVNSKQYYYGMIANIMSSNYARSFSARGYFIFNFANGEKAVYTPYSETNNARSIFYIINGVYNGLDSSEKAIADVMRNNVIQVTYNGSSGVAYAGVDETDVLTGLTHGVEGDYYVVDIMTSVNISSVMINGDCVALGDTFNLYGDVYKKVHHVTRLATNRVKIYCYLEAATFAVSNTRGNTITWDAVDNAAYYAVTDDNSNVGKTIITPDQTLAYTPFSAGTHNVTVTVYPANNEFAPTSRTVTQECTASVLIAPFSEGKYAFDTTELTKMGYGDTSVLDAAENGKYYLYRYNGGWDNNSTAKRGYTNMSYTAQLTALKNAGINVLMLANGPYAFGTGFYWETSDLKRLMDEAWYDFGIKCLVYDTQLTNLEGSSADITSAVNSRMSKSEVQAYFTHPGFFGILVQDEPTWSKLDYVVNKYNDIRTKAATFGKTNVCVFSILKMYGSDALFEGNSYADYIQKWFDYTNADYVAVDDYSPYINGTVFTASTFKNTYTNIRAKAGSNKNVYGFATAFDYSGIPGVNDGGASLTAKAFYQNAYLVMAYRGELGYFTGYPSSAETTLAHTFFDFDGNATTTATWVGTANADYTEIRRILNGYHYDGDYVGSNYIVTSWADDANDNIKASFYVNTSTSANATVNFNVSSGKTYYKFNNDGTYTSGTTSTSITVGVGEMFIILP